MSKQLGNSPDPIELMEKFGADGVRIGYTDSSAGNDLFYDGSLYEQDATSIIKYECFRLVKGWEVADVEQSRSAKLLLNGLISTFKNNVWR